MANELAGKTVAILVADGFEEVELTSPREALREAGATVRIVSPAGERVRGWDHDHWSEEVAVDIPVDEAEVEDFDALVLPGGQMNPDHLRLDEGAVRFVRGFFDAGKPIAAICHGPWMLVEAGLVRGRRMTSWPSLRTDLENAGARWVDREVVVAEGIVTSRKPDDLPAFNRKMIEEIGEGTHERVKRTAAD